MASCFETDNKELLLFDFESDEDIDQILWKCHTLFSLSNKNTTRGTHSLRLELYPSEYPGVILRVKVNDWSKYKILLFDIYNPEDKELSIIVRIDDTKENTNFLERFNKGFTLTPGFNQIYIPLSLLVTSGDQNSLNLKTIYKLTIFMAHLKNKQVLFLDNIRLIK